MSTVQRKSLTDNTVSANTKGIDTCPVKLRTLRAKKGFSQADLAIAINVHRRSINSYERPGGARSIRYVHFRSLVRVLGCRAEDLHFGVAATQPMPPKVVTTSCELEDAALAKIAKLASTQGQKVSRMLGQIVERWLNAEGSYL